MAEKNWAGGHCYHTQAGLSVFGALFGWNGSAFYLKVVLDDVIKMNDKMRRSYENYQKGSKHCEL